ncbi:MAG: PAS domain-containing protein, partial [Acidimicrobiales bacterium]
GAEDFGSLGDSDPIPQLVVDERGAVLAANRPARRQFALGATDIGEPLRDGLLTVSHPELRNVIDQVLRDRKAVTISGVDLGGARSSPSFDVIVAPMHGTAGVVLAFVDVTRYRTLGADLVRAQDALETAYEELQSTVEELETTNEEMQSTNEELETTNEELQSTNEELETMNEELQSTNEELETMNEELRVRNTQVAVLNSFLESILSSLNSAVIVLGSEMEIRAWNHQAEDLWGLRSAEVQEQHFMNLDIGFPLESLAAPLRACLSGRSMGAQVTEPAVNRRGKTVECTVTISPLVSDGTLQGAILLMDAVSVSASED